ncbi:MAG: hypothetical protein JXA01_03120 [Dehalococcoidia bacterium]|nr:hypothetical protein [Dehalococcoidia bacterium]
MDRKRGLWISLYKGFKDTVVPVLFAASLFTLLSKAIICKFPNYEGILTMLGWVIPLIVLLGFGLLWLVLVITYKVGKNKNNEEIEYRTAKDKEIDVIKERLSKFEIYQDKLNRLLLSHLEDKNTHKKGEEK